MCHWKCNIVWEGPWRRECEETGRAGRGGRDDPGSIDKLGWARRARSHDPRKAIDTVGSRSLLAGAWAGHLPTRLREIALSHMVLMQVPRSLDLPRARQGPYEVNAIMQHTAAHMYVITLRMTPCPELCSPFRPFYGQHKRTIANSSHPTSGSSATRPQRPPSPPMTRAAPWVGLGTPGWWRSSRSHVRCADHAFAAYRPPQQAASRDLGYGVPLQFPLPTALTSYSRGAPRRESSVIANTCINAG